MWFLLPAFAFLAADLAEEYVAQADYGLKIARERDIDLPTDDKPALIKKILALGNQAVEAAGGREELAMIRRAELRADEVAEAGSTTTKVLETVYGEQPTQEELVANRSLPMLTAADRPVYAVATEPATNETNWALLVGVGLLGWAWLR